MSALVEHMAKGWYFAASTPSGALVVDAHDEHGNLVGTIEANDKSGLYDTSGTGVGDRYYAVEWVTVDEIHRGGGVADALFEALQIAANDVGASLIHDDAHTPAGKAWVRGLPGEKWGEPDFEEEGAPLERVALPRRKNPDYIDRLAAVRTPTTETPRMPKMRALLRRITGHHDEDAGVLEREADIRRAGLDPRLAEARHCDRCGDAIAFGVSRTRDPHTGEMICEACASGREAGPLHGRSAPKVALPRPTAVRRRDLSGGPPQRRVAHDSGDGERVFHCFSCGSGAIIGRGDGSIECLYCKVAFSVQVQPSNPGMPQTVNGVPYDNPEMPGQVDPAPAPPAPGTAPGAPPPPGGGAEGPPPFGSPGAAGLPAPPEGGEQGEPPFGGETGAAGPGGAPQSEQGPVPEPSQPGAEPTQEAEPPVPVTAPGAPPSVPGQPPAPAFAQEPQPVPASPQQPQVQQAPQPGAQQPVEAPVVPGAEQEDPEDESNIPPQFRKKKEGVRLFRTADGHLLEEEDYLRHLAVRFATSPPRMREALHRRRAA
jgi:GNAT superfamily N-acetyltransferase